MGSAKKKKILKYLGKAVTEPRQQAFIVSDIIIVNCAFCIRFLRCQYFLPTIKDGLQRSVTFRRELEKQLEMKTPVMKVQLTVKWKEELLFKWSFQVQ